MTIGGVNAIVALGVLAAIGDVARFSSPQKLVSYFGLNPKVRQPGDRPAYHGRISRQGRAHARAMLVEAAWSPSPGRYEHSSTASSNDAASRSPLSRLLGSDLALAHEQGGLRLDQASSYAMENP